jgi:hypothetical protein
MIDYVMYRMTLALRRLHRLVIFGDRRFGLCFMM